MNPPAASRPHLFGVLAGLALAAGLIFAALVFAVNWLTGGREQRVKR